MIYETAKNYKPDLILLGHSYDIGDTLERIKIIVKILISNGLRIMAIQAQTLHPIEKSYLNMITL